MRDRRLLYSIGHLTHSVSLTAGTILGIFLLVTFGISIFAIVQRNHVTTGLVILNWVLIMDSVVVIVVGSFIWFYSLQQRNNYYKVFKSVSAATRVEIQDHVRTIGTW